MTEVELYKNEHLTWIDIQDLDKNKIPEISAKYGINSYFLEDCIDPNHLPKYEVLDDLYFILTRQNASERINLNTITDVSTKIGIFIKNNLLLTVHRIANDGILSISEGLHSGKIKAKNPFDVTLLLGREVLNSFHDEEEMLREQMDKLENEVFLKNVSSSSQIKRLYRFKRKVNLNLKVLNLSQEWVNFMEKLPLDEIAVKDFKDNYKDVVTDFEHLSNQSANMISLFLALADQKNNEAMKLLSTYSIYFLPITFIASVYGMNFEWMPLLKNPNGFTYIIAIMLLIVVVTFIYIRRRKL